MMAGSDTLEKGLAGEHFGSQSDVPLLTPEPVDDMQTVPLNPETSPHSEVPVVCTCVRRLRPVYRESASQRRSIRTCLAVVFYFILSFLIFVTMAMVMYLIYNQFHCDKYLYTIAEKLNKQEEILRQIQGSKVHL
ncbi:Hypothetical predicted protein [Pelobates cultripes]|uniref:Uncharacterized protein n=1 Tax=Pelobates cultripes TaxID=61616 RepID=A0AAD1SY70_PELCU|nr:Hypothetical predicted protein [Pelobates cultripes]